MNVKSKFDLTGKIAVVTGASRGLGQGYAVALASAGAYTIVLSRTKEKLEETVTKIETAGGKGEAVPVDITDINAVKGTVDKTIEKHGKIDILVNNAGTEIPNNFLDVSEKDYDTIMNVNMKAMYFTSQAVASHMVKENHGKIINIGSLGSHIGLAKATVYCASKGGVTQFTKALALEMAPYNIQVNAIAPGYFHTELTDPFFKDPNHLQWIEERIPKGRIGTEEDLAATVVFLASQASDYITGEVINVDGGWMAG